MIGCNGCTGGRTPVTVHPIKRGLLTGVRAAPLCNRGLRTPVSNLIRAGVTDFGLEDLHTCPSPTKPRSWMPTTPGRSG